MKHKVKEKSIKRKRESNESVHSRYKKSIEESVVPRRIERKRWVLKYQVDNLIEIFTIVQSMFYRTDKDCFLSFLKENPKEHKQLEDTWISIKDIFESISQTGETEGINWLDVVQEGFSNEFLNCVEESETFDDMVECMFETMEEVLDEFIEEHEEEIEEMEDV
jgi:hypothetical protein|tara:strand:- start:2293 stop:2784 length:492 start_codon:yes stop_codon:yes gene_type:complete